MSDHEATLRRLGREVFGPAFLTQLLRTVEIVDARRFRALYFLARDGWLLLELYRQMGALHRREPPPARYLEVSRRSTSLASVERFGARELGMVRRSRRKGLRSVLRSFDLLDDQTLRLAARAGFDE